ncbi:hypothetical protein EPI10_023524 [Gossypium australe]|uniref:Uncharacterized protein n=1 Tax=Gossypium australe TaxID=47621 RepID=A0A5B6VVA6_9ROSI|nr:hypothetical protein EPI10_023524 [Gossypium australe]
MNCSLLTQRYFSGYFADMVSLPLDYLASHDQHHQHTSTIDTIHFELRQHASRQYQKGHRINKTTINHLLYSLRHIVSLQGEICDCEENPAPAIGELAWFEEEVLLLVRRDYARIAPEMQ